LVPTIAAPANECIIELEHPSSTLRTSRLVHDRRRTKTQAQRFPALRSFRQGSPAGAVRRERTSRLLWRAIRCLCRTRPALHPETRRTEDAARYKDVLEALSGVTERE
jgi:hypothetical protein